MLPTVVRASSVQINKAELNSVLKSALRESGFCAVQELADNPEPDTLFLISSISKTNRFDINGPTLNGRRLNQANFDVTAQVGVVDLTAGQLLYQRSVIGESQFDGFPSLAEGAELYQKAALGSLAESVRRLASEYRPGIETGKVVRTTPSSVMVDLGRKHGIGLQRLEVVGVNGRVIGLLRVRVAEADYSVCALEHGAAPQNATVRAVGVRRLKDGIRPKYAVLPVTLPNSLINLGVDGERVADSLQSALFTANKLEMLAPIYNDDLLQGQDLVERRTSLDSLSIKNRREQPDGFIEASVTEASVGRQQSETGTRLIYRVFVQVRLIDAVSRQVHAQLYRTETHEEVIKQGIREIDAANPVYFIDLINKAFRGAVEDLKSKNVSLALRGQIAAKTSNVFYIRFESASQCATGHSLSVFRSDGAKEFPELRLIGYGAMQPNGAACTVIPKVMNEAILPGDLVRADYQYQSAAFATSTLLFSAAGDTDAVPYMEAAVGDWLPLATVNDPWNKAGELFDKPELPFATEASCRAVFAFRNDPPQSIKDGVALRSVGTLEWQGEDCKLNSTKLGNTVTVQWKNSLSEVPYDFYRGQAVRVIAFELVKRAVQEARKTP